MASQPMPFYRRLEAAGDLVAFAGLVLAVLLAGNLISAAMKLELSLTAGLVSMLPIALILLAGTTWILRRRDLTWRDMGFVWDGSVTGVLRLVLETLLIVAAVYLVLQLVMPLIRAGVGGSPDLGLFQEMGGDWGRFLLALLAVWTAAAFAEEMLFRGFLMNRIAWLMGGSRAAWIAAAILQSALFGAAHAYQGPAGMLLTGVMGAMLGLAFLAVGRRLGPLILAHGAINSASLAQVFVAG